MIAYYWIYLVLSLCLFSKVVKGDEDVIPGRSGNYSYLYTTEVTTFYDDASTAEPVESLPSLEVRNQWIQVVFDEEDLGYGADCLPKVHAFIVANMPYVHPNTMPGWIAFCRCWLKLCDHVFGYELSQEQRDRFAALDKEFVKREFYKNLDRNVAVIVGYSFSFLFGLIGNTLVIWTIARYLPKDNITNIFIMSLAVADLMVCVFCIPFRVVRIAYDRWMLGGAMCYITSVWYFLGLCASALNLTFMGLERYLAIVFPLKAQMLNSPGRAKRTVCFIWFLAIAMSVPSYMIIERFHEGCGIKRFVPVTNRYYYFLFVAVYLIPLITLTYLYGHICVTLWKSISASAAMKGATSSSKSGDDKDADARKRLKKKTIRVIKMLAAVVVIFALCWGPMLVYNVLFEEVFEDWLDKTGHLHNNVYPFLELVTYFNSCLNPFLYAFFSSQFRKGFKRSLGSGPRAIRSSIYSSSASNMTSVSRASTRT